MYGEASQTVEPHIGTELEELVPSQGQHNFQGDAWPRFRGHRGNSQAHGAQEQVGRSVPTQDKDQ